jgi:hypothetical protein
MFVDPCIIVRFIKQNQTMYQNFIISYLYEAQHVSGDTPTIIRSLKLYWQPLAFHTWKVVSRVAGGKRLPATCPTTFHVWKTRGCQCSFRLIMMGGVSPETCWASYKYRIIKFRYIVAYCWIFLYEYLFTYLCFQGFTFFIIKTGENTVEKLPLPLSNCVLERHTATDVCFSLQLNIKLPEMVCHRYSGE